MAQKLREYSSLVMAVLAAYWCGLFTLTHLPASYLPGPVMISDRLAHLLGFAMLSFLAGLSIGLQRRYTWRAMLVMGAVLAAYGAADEWTQQFIPGRDCDLMDWMADLAGIALGSLAAWTAWTLVPLLALRPAGLAHQWVSSDPHR